MRVNTCLLPKKKNPLPNSGTKGLSLPQNWFCWGVFCYFFFNQIQKRSTSEFIPNQRSSLWFPKGLYLISKIKNTAVIKSSKPKTTCGDGKITDHSKKAQKKRPFNRRFFCEIGASVSLFPLRRISTPHTDTIAHRMETLNMSMWVYWLWHVTI